MKSMQIRAQPRPMLCRRGGHRVAAVAFQVLLSRVLICQTRAAA
jgi:hypothetical protein